MGKTLHHDSCELLFEVRLYRIRYAPFKVEYKMQLMVQASKEEEYQEGVVMRRRR